MSKLRDVHWKTHVLKGLEWFTDLRKKDRALHKSHYDFKQSYFFQKWVTAVWISKRRSVILKSWVHKKEHLATKVGFWTWKKETFFNKLVGKIHDHWIVPENQEIETTFFSSWKRVTEFNKVRDDYYQILKSKNTVFLALWVFKEWNLLT